MFTNLRRWLHRKAVARRAREWAETLERLERQRNLLPANIIIAERECRIARRELSELDRPLPKITHAPGPGKRDGVVRFSIVSDAKAGR